MNISFFPSFFLGGCSILSFTSSFLRFTAQSGPVHTYIPCFHQAPSKITLRLSFIISTSTYVLLQFTPWVASILGRVVPSESRSLCSPARSIGCKECMDMAHVPPPQNTTMLARCHYTRNPADNNAGTPTPRFKQFTLLVRGTISANHTPWSVTFEETGASGRDVIRSRTSSATVIVAVSQSGMGASKWGQHITTM